MLHREFSEHSSLSNGNASSGEKLARAVSPKSKSLKVATANSPKSKSLKAARVVSMKSKSPKVARTVSPKSKSPKATRVVSPKSPKAVRVVSPKSKSPKAARVVSPKAESHKVARTVSPKSKRLKVAAVSESSPHSESVSTRLRSRTKQNKLPFEACENKNVPDNCVLSSEAGVNVGEPDHLKTVDEKLCNDIDGGDKFKFRDGLCSVEISGGKERLPAVSESSPHSGSVSMRLRSRTKQKDVPFETCENKNVPDNCVLNVGELHHMKTVDEKLCNGIDVGDKFKFRDGLCSVDISGGKERLPAVSESSPHSGSVSMRLRSRTKQNKLPFETCENKNVPDNCVMSSEAGVNVGEKDHLKTVDEKLCNDIDDGEKSKFRDGLCSVDISGGKERLPICAVNEIDGEKPPPFIYTVKMIYPDWCRPIPPRGCGCTKRCSKSKSCSCVANNGGKLPYHNDGTIVRKQPLVYECGPNCKCPPSCYLRVTQHGIKIQLEIFKTESRGWGVRSRNLIPSGSFICEYAGELLEEKEVERLAGKDEYLFDIGKEHEMSGFTIDGARKGNIGRFINHSCSPNLYAQEVLYDYEESRISHVMFFAGDDIPPLQELSYDYNYSIDQVRDGNGNIKKKYCHCGSSECTGRLY